MQIESEHGLSSDSLTKRERTLQKRGIVNLSAAELQEWTRLCERMEDGVHHAKARRSWKESRLKAEERLTRLHCERGTEHSQ